MTQIRKTLLLCGRLGKNSLASFIILALVVGMTACAGRETAELRELVKEQGKRLQQLEDIQAIERLQRAYGYYVDKQFNIRTGYFHSDLVVFAVIISRRGTA